MRKIAEGFKLLIWAFGIRKKDKRSEKKLKKACSKKEDPKLDDYEREILFNLSKGTNSFLI